MRRVGLAVGLLLLSVAPAAAQALQSTLVVSGLLHPVAFVQDPTLADTQYVVEMAGRIRVVHNGQLTTPDFLDLQGVTSDEGERGLLGMAYAPDYATSGRFFVNFTNVPDGFTVIARFVRSSGNPRIADASTRFNLIWPDAQEYISQPYTNHNGGNLQFGPDGYLYIGLGDGGSGGDPQHRAQNPATLLGKFLRIDVNVSVDDPEGYNVPPTNPFVNTLSYPGYLREIWSFGWRNPWRYSFDAFGTGATGALIVGDVGQNEKEEIDYEPANTGGRNYGWSIREGAQNYNTSRAAAYTPLRDPLLDYARTPASLLVAGATVVGGYVYRGTALPSTYRGRYFWADFVSARVWSMTLTLGGGGDATAGTVTEHTAELGGTSTLGNISSFGIDASGELYVVSYGNGTIRKITGTQLTMALDLVNNATVVQPFAAAGWALDLNNSSATGVDSVHTWAFPMDGSAAIFLGASYGVSRPDVTTAFGSQYQNPGYSVSVSGLAAGSYRVTAFARSTVTGGFDRTASAVITVARGPLGAIDAPANGGTVAARFSLSGWAADLDSASGTGVDAVHVWAYPSSGAQRFLGVATYGASRTDVGASYGSRFTNSGWSFSASGLPAGTWTLVAFAHSTVTGTFRSSTSATVQVQSGLLMAIDAPPAGVVTGAFQVVGWALDLANSSNAGISAVHVWAFPVGGGAQTFLGVATIGGSRPDVGNVFGSQFTPSGFLLNVSSLANGPYDVVVFAQSSLTGAFDLARVVRIQKN